jgi:hypothetical protein
MVNIEALLVQRIMLLSHERGKEVTAEETCDRADRLCMSLSKRGQKAKRIDALELMIELLGSNQWK